MPEITERYKVKSLGIFGSYARKEAKKSSDLEILVAFHQAPSHLQFIRRDDELSEKLGIKVDLVMKKALKTHIGRRIMAEVKDLDYSAIRSISKMSPEQNPLPDRP